MRIKSVLVYLFGILLLLFFAFASLSTIEFYYAKKDKRIPILAIKKENKKNQYYEYNALFYKVYKCYSNDVYLKSKKDEAPSCPRLIIFDKNNNYVTNSNVSISKMQYQLLLTYVPSYTSIEDMTEEEINNIVYVLYNMGLLKHKEVDYNNKINLGGKIVEVHAFYNFKVMDSYGNYSWNPEYSNKDYYKCMMTENGKELFSSYKDGKCEGEFKNLYLDSKWCILAKDMNNAEIKDAYQKYCD